MSLTNLTSEQPPIFLNNCSELHAALGKVTSDNLEGKREASGWLLGKDAAWQCPDNVIGKQFYKLVWILPTSVQKEVIIISISLMG